MPTMNPLTALQPHEETLKQERLHPGLFALPILTFIVPTTAPLLTRLYTKRAHPDHTGRVLYDGSAFDEG